MYIFCFFYFQTVIKMIAVTRYAGMDQWLFERNRNGNVYWNSESFIYRHAICAGNRVSHQWSALQQFWLIYYALSILLYLYCVLLRTLFIYYVSVWYNFYLYYIFLKTMLKTKQANLWISFFCNERLKIFSSIVNNSTDHSMSIHK